MGLVGCLVRSTVGKVALAGGLVGRVGTLVRSTAGNVGKAEAGSKASCVGCAGKMGRAGLDGGGTAGRAA